MFFLVMGEKQILHKHKKLNLENIVSILRVSLNIVWVLILSRFAKKRSKGLWQVKCDETY